MTCLRAPLAAALVVVAALGARPAVGASADAKARAAQPWSASEHQATLDRLQQRSKAFYEALEHGERERASGMWPEIESGLASLADELQERLDDMRQEVMDKDGDIDELYRSPRWREPEIMSLVATYHLAWVRYQGAQLVGDPAKKKALLQKAVQGFSQFLLVNEVPDIYAESLYGRGLAFMDLGETGKAIEDLQAAIDAGGGVAGKARAALDEARRRASGGKAPAAPENGPEQLLGKLGELLPRAAAGDAAAEKEATTLARGLAARGGEWPARVTSTVVQKLGADAPAKVRSSFGLFLLGELAVDRSRCADVAPLAEASADVADAGRARHRPELLFLDAGCRLNGGHPREAADEFGVLLREFPDAARAREAAYFRFRALDVARASDPSLAPAFDDALAAYVARWGRAEGGAEARFLQAELHRAQGDCARAEREYAAVPAGPFALRARLGTLECRAVALPSGKGSAKDREAFVADVRAFVGEHPDEPIAARASLLAAAVAAARTPPDHAVVLEMLDGFETRFPGARDLRARAVELRLDARVGAGRLDGAAADLNAYLAGAAAGPERRAFLERVGHALVGATERGNAPDALALAHRVYEVLVQGGGGTADRVVLADLALRAGDAAAARKLYEQAVAADPGSLEALRGAARAAAAAGDRNAALGYWRRVFDASPPGGTGWFEARIAQVSLLAEDGRKAQACELVRGARGRATSAGADQLEARLRGMEPDVCR